MAGRGRDAVSLAAAKTGLATDTRPAVRIEDHSSMREVETGRVGRGLLKATVKKKTDPKNADDEKCKRESGA